MSKIAHVAFKLECFYSFQLELKKIAQFQNLIAWKFDSRRGNPHQIFPLSEKHSWVSTVTV